MPDLILLNGPPASGKSTLAARLVEGRPLALNLDIDQVRGMLGDWLATPIEAGLAARALAADMASRHLRSGHDVVVPQFLGRIDFVDTLEQVASTAEARFIEIALILDREGAVAAFNERREEPQNQRHRDAADLVDRSDATDPLGEMHEAFHNGFLRPR